MKSRKAMAPLISTVILIVFAAMLGIMVMGWGTIYAESADCSSVSLIIEEENGVVRVVPKINNILCDEKSIEVKGVK
ncbi:MAG: hypothetical protein KAU20_06265 [Nanoarchaeota archaeon]|nr:hypothetical protein [Nanoarchaeota archaeon]